MIDSLITSKTRIKMLLKFFLNSNTTAYLRSLEKDLGESTNAIRLELNRFSKAGLLKTKMNGNKKVYQANTEHPLYKEINSIIRKTVGIDKIVDRITSQAGDLKEVYLAGNFAAGIDSDTIELIFNGENLDTGYIDNLISVAEKHVHRKIVYVILTKDQMKHFYHDKPVLLIWEKDD